MIPTSFSWMRFNDSEVEREFQIRYHDRAAKNSQFIAVVGFFLYFFSMIWFGNYAPINLLYFAGVATLWLLCEWKAVRIYGQFLGCFGFTLFFGCIDVWLSHKLAAHSLGDLTYLTTIYVFVCYALLRLFLIPSVVASVSISIIHLYLLVRGGAEASIIDNSLTALLVANVVGMLLSYRLEINFRNMFISHSDLRLELKRQQKVLQNIMPAAVAEKLKNEFKDITFDNDNVVIISADLVDYTKYSANVSPDQLLNVLNKVYSAFDEIADGYDFMKVKTLGDAIILASGIEGRCRPNRAVDVAIAMREKALQIFKELDASMGIRIGIGLGSCSSGVLGELRPKFDVWGEALEQAERMESKADSGQILISEDVEVAVSHKTLSKLNAANKAASSLVA